MLIVRRLSAQAIKVGEMESLQPFLIFVTKYGGFPATKSIESGLESGYTRQKTEQQAEEDPAESVDHDASGFGV